MITDLQLAYNQFQEDENNSRVVEQKKQYDYYMGNQTAIKEYLEEALSYSFSSDTTVNMIKHWINLTKKVIDQLSVLYNKAAKRTILINGVPDKELTDYYNSILPSNINTVDKMALRLARLNNVSLTQIFIDKKTKQLVYRVEPAWKVSVVSDENNPNKMDLLAYQRYYKHNGEDELYYVVWTDNNHYIVDRNENEVPVGDNIDMINPYGTIPFAVLRVSEADDFWGEGQSDLVNFNEIINLLLTDLLDSGLIMGSAVTPVATNLNLRYKSEDGTFKPYPLSIGMKHPLVAEDVRTEMVQPRLEFVKPDAPIAEIMKSIDDQIKLIAITKGLNPNTLIAEVKSTSGYSKIMDSLEEIHIREDVIEQTRAYEEDRFNISRAVINAHAAELGLKTIPDNAILKVNFAEVNIPKTVQEKWLDREQLIKFNLATPVDFLMEDDKDISEADAEMRLKKNAEFNKNFQINDFTRAVNVEQTEKKTQL